MDSKRVRPATAVPAKLYPMIATAFLLVGQTRPGMAQQAALSHASFNALPNAPSQAAPGPQQQMAKGSATLTGAIIDQTGASVRDARVTLTGSGEGLRVVRSGDDGSFTFSNLPAGTFHLMVEATGFAPVSSAPVSLRDNETIAAPTISLLVAANDAQVEVRGDTEAIANEQIKAEERQRVLGVVPNFYTSYVYDAAPLDAKQKYTFALRETFDPVRFVATAIGAGIQQANNNFKGYGSGAAGYGKRYAALYGTGLFSDMLSHAVFPVIFHQDPRYFYQGSGTVKSRFIHAISFAVVIRSDSGRTGSKLFLHPWRIGSGRAVQFVLPACRSWRGTGLHERCHRGWGAGRGQPCGGVSIFALDHSPCGQGEAIVICHACPWT